MPHAPQAVPLVPHPAAPSTAAKSVVVHLRSEPNRLALRYVVTGAAYRLRIPAPRAPSRADGLWRHTCFELFVGDPRARYREFNFSPSGEWAAYAFAGYRQGKAPLDCEAPGITVRASGSLLELVTAVPHEAHGAVKLGLSAVLEDNEGALSYWALRHPSPRPDFHHADAFALDLDEVRH
jgi:hypothetical protein